MRIISQDEMLDVPYEQVVVGIDQLEPKKIIAYGVHDSSESFCLPLGSYSSKEKALKVFRDLRTAYASDFNKIFHFPKDGEVAE